jgi:FkbH-like protein
VNARAELARALAKPTVTAYLEAARGLRDGRYDLRPQRAVRLAIARTFTMELLLPYLTVECALAGVQIQTHLGDFGAYRQELLDPQSALYAFGPDVVLLAIAAEDVVPTLTHDFLRRTPAEIASARDEAVADLKALAEAFRARSQATLVLHTLPPPTYPAAGAADRMLRPGQRETFELLNQGISRICDEVRGVEVFDLAAHVAGVGQLGWEDPRFNLLVRAPFAARHLPGLARAYARLLALIVGIRRKCVVVDLDNTLWGGVVGEDGWEGIRLGAEYPGAAFVAFQRALLDLQQRGVLIAVASKNEEADALRVFDQRREMLIKREHVASWRVDWRDKATNLSEIADELGLGLDALVFIDDDPTERALVARMLPEVLVPDWPAEPADYVAALHAIPTLDSLRLTGEDRARSDLYLAEARRKEQRSGARSVEEFLHSLELRATITRVGPATVARAAQLTQKTNQFNLTLRRYTDSEIATLAGSPDHDVYLLSLRDRFGDAGRVAVCIVTYAGDVARIEGLLMSCRVLGRGVETFLLAHLAGVARARGATWLEGSYTPGPRNGQVADLYPRHGFVPSASSPNLWSLDLRSNGPLYPLWITPEETEGVVLPA